MLRLGVFIAFCLLLLTGASALPTTKIRGTAMGGWLLMEKFISTSVMTSNDTRIVDEWTFGIFATKEQREELQDYWSNYYTEADFQQMKEAGLTHARIALGYWHLCTQPELDWYDEPYVTGGWELGLVPTLARMKPYGIKAILDLHGVPGSQNGFDNSGHLGDIKWGTGDTLNRTYTILERMVQRVVALESDVATSGVIVGIEPINEAACWGVTGPVPLSTLQEYLYNAYDIVRAWLPASDYMFVVEHAFLYDQWAGFMSEPQYENVWIDAHIYQAFSPGLYNVSYSAHYYVTCVDQMALVKKFTLPTFVGEWSLGYKMGSWNSEFEPYPTAAQQSFLRKWFLYQVDVWENSHNSQGWFFWTWKTDSSPFWDYMAGMSGGWIPSFINDTVVTAGACPAPPTPPPTTIIPDLTTVTSTSATTRTAVITTATTSAVVNNNAETSASLPLAQVLCIVFILVICIN